MENSRGWWQNLGWMCSFIALEGLQQAVSLSACVPACQIIQVPPRETSITHTVTHFMQCPCPATDL